eukprot:CAMPEP_0196780608 /NCGR_PEP_ID=MMETSP1104-20130614/8190_1 /TAXON_ID=33652 /ORGANISM="Cafeteria sp., Strain Caron Lab Isolate" /LENGTH=195 /DNA_ID=CAMNT_0042150821 /DNA_START=82 /DNA_END=667 /DNA_ORIENTATION=-
MVTKSSDASGAPTHQQRAKVDGLARGQLRATLTQTASDTWDPAEERLPVVQVLNPAAHCVGGARLDPLPLVGLSGPLAAVVEPVDLVLEPPHQADKHQRARLLVRRIAQPAAKVRLVLLLVLHDIHAHLAAALGAPNLGLRLQERHRVLLTACVLGQQVRVISLDRLRDQVRRMDDPEDCLGHKETQDNPLRHFL